jgi:hypothetical protein
MTKDDLSKLLNNNSDVETVYHALRNFPRFVMDC